MPTSPDPQNHDPADKPKQQHDKCEAAHDAAMDNPVFNAEAHDPLEWGWRQNNPRFNSL